MKTSRRALIPNLITFTSLIFAFTAIGAALRQELTLAGVCILIGYVLDALDGAAARRLGVTSDFGVQLDSLTDMVIFGVGPSMLLYQYLAQMGFSPAVLWGTCTAYLVGGAFRLARFNLLPQKQSNTENVGLTISTAGATLTLAVLANRAHDDVLFPAVVTAGIAIVLMLLMVSRIRYPAMSAVFGRPWLNILGIGGGAVLAYLLSLQLVCFGMISGYVSFGLLRAARELMSRWFF
jgi:CDP-diacylglycerol--serine O-phosphatidyltransferase